MTEQPPTIGRMLIAGVGGCIVILVLLLGVHFARARDDGRYANSPNKEWFEGLHSKSGAWCCSEADGETNIDWRTKDDHYQVMLLGRWIDVPPDAVVEGQNKIGRAIVWPIYAHSGATVRCFMPGTMG